MTTLPTVSGGSGPRFIRHTGTASFVRMPDEPPEEITPDSVMELENDASIVLVREPFVPSAPEAMLARLAALAVRAVVAPGFESRFFDECVACGVLPVTVGDEVIDELAGWVASHPEVELTVDLEEQVIERPGMDPVSFGVDPRARNKLLLGLTDLEEMMRYVGNISTFRSADRKRRPWLYDSG